MGNEFKQMVVGTFDRAADLYGQVGADQFTYFANRMIESLEIPAGARVLDVATGRGALLFPAAARVGQQGQVIGVDLAPAMVRHTHAEIAVRGLKNVHVCVMDGDHIGFRPNTFDFAFCGNALHFLDHAKALPMFRNALKPGGCFAAIQPFAPYDAVQAARWQWLFDLTKAVFPPDFRPPEAWIAPRKLGTPELAARALLDAGFVDFRVERHEADLPFRDADDWWDWEWSQGSRFWLEGMSPEGLERFRREAYGHLLQMQADGGISIRFGALFAVGYKAR